MISHLTQLLDIGYERVGRWSRSTVLVTLLLVGALQNTQAQAGNLEARDILEDTKLYFTAPVRWDADDWKFFGGSLVAIGVAHEFDEDVRSHFIDKDHAQAPGEDSESTRDAIPAALLLGGTLTAAWVTGDQGGYTEAWSMAEAGALSGLTALVMKSAFGRQRPNDTAHVDDWFSGGDSFPSMHTTVAFAIGSVLAESGSDRYRWVRRLLGYGVAGGTAYLRMRENVHWMSDTVAGASIGFATAEFVVNRRQEKKRSGSFQVVPMNDGVMLTYSGTLH